MKIKSNIKENKKNPLERNGRHWTEEELDFLYKNLSRMPLEKLAKKLRRTPLSIQRKLSTDNGTRKISLLEGMFTTKDLANILKVSDDTVLSWINLHEFPAIMLKNKYFDDVNNKRRLRYVIDPAIVWDWVKDNRDKMNVYANEIERGIILPEPQWFIEDAKNKKFYGRNEPWTNDMRAKLYKLRYIDGLKLKECAEIFGKSIFAIQKQTGKIDKMKTSEINKLMKHIGFY